jgi:hypothetical protein
VVSRLLIDEFEFGQFEEDDGLVLIVHVPKDLIPLLSVVSPEGIESIERRFPRLEVLHSGFPE